MNHVPVVNRWQAPNTIGELKEALELNNLSWDTDVVRLLDKMRDGKRHFQTFLCSKFASDSSSPKSTTLFVDCF